MNRRSWLLVIIGVGLLCSALWVASCPSSDSPEQETSQADAGQGAATSDAGIDDADGSPDQTFVDETAEGRAVRVVRDGEPVAGVGIVAGAPGSYPPELGETDEDGVFVVEHAATETMGGGRVGWVELYGFDGETAFWKTLDLTRDEPKDVALEPAHQLQVTVRRASGAVMANATVRLSRDAVGLVLLESVTASDGVTTFGAVPDGTYHLSVDLPGYLTRVETATVDGSDASIDLVVEPGARVTGRVLGVDGRPATGAVVAVYTETSDAGAAVPSAIVATDALGEFEAAGLPPGPTWAVASHDGAAPARSSTIDTREGASTLEVTLAPAISLAVRVVSEAGEPVGDAIVTWRDPDTSAGGAASTNESGRTRLRSVVPGSTIFAALQGWESRRNRVDTDDDGTTIELVLSRGEPPKRLRISDLPDDASELVLTSENGEACAVDTIDERDFRVSGCPAGPATLEVVSESAGTATVTFDLTDGASINLPERLPFSVLVRISGPDVVPTSDWSDGRRWRRFDLEQTDDRTWRGQANLYPGRYLTRADAPGHALEESAANLSVGGEEIESNLSELVRHEVFILDVRRSPVTGARVEVWNDAKRVRIARSAGQLPVVVEHPAQGDWYLVALDPRRGEARVPLTGERIELRLTEPVGSVTTPRRLGPERLADAVDLELARDGRAWLLDPVPGGAAARSGVERGDHYVTARMLGEAIELVVWSSGKYRTIRIP